MASHEPLRGLALLRPVRRGRGWSGEGRPLPFPATDQGPMKLGSQRVAAGTYVTISSAATMAA